MLRTKKSIVVNAPVDRVFGYLADLTCHHEWNGAPLIQFAPTTPEPVGLESTFESIGSAPPVRGAYNPNKPVHVIMKITEFIPNERIVLDRLMISAVGGGKIINHDIFSFTVRITDNGTHVTKTNETVFTHLNIVVRLLGAPFVYLIGAMIFPLTSWWEGRSLRRFKSRMESKGRQV